MEVINDIEQEDIYNIALPFVELGIDEYDETNNIIHQNIRFCKFFKQQEMCYNILHDICLPTYIVLTVVSSSRLDQIKSYIKNNSTEEMVHSNIECTFIQSNHATINEKILQEVNNFIHNYVNIHGFPSPG
ncbi:5132_t:CDS:2 [Cetraspora pellucida]|uniref:5132_t:CDS:1 n=1 Tax=Cetraspora pellucida TaxID=1433469 RepID=A0A9N8ZJH7_9GLOM|nr:5132_t:CDS:2 [Cetraspora pellucida]